MTEGAITAPYYCSSCRKPLEQEIMEEPSPESRASHICQDRGCDLYYVTQPQEPGSSLVTWSNDGFIITYLRGPTSLNEQNVPGIVECLRKHLPPRFQVEVVETSGGRETGADVAVRCIGCQLTTEGQVVRAISEELARRASGPEGVAWARESPEELFARAQRRVEKKTSRYAPVDVRSRLLIIDAGVELFWTTLFGNEPVVKAIAASTPWHGVVLAAPSRLIWAKGHLPICQCSDTTEPVASMDVQTAVSAEPEPDAV
jgi:hypothetical protein